MSTEGVPQRSSAFKILGQKFPYPENFYEIGGLLVFLAAVGVVAWILFVRAKPENLVVLTGTIFDSKGETVSKPTPAHLVQFWSPSSKTCQSVKDDIRESVGGDHITGEEQWECPPEGQNDPKYTDEKVAEFARHLVAFPGVTGFRRYEVYGHGRTRYKTGWWWVLNVSKAFDTKSLVVEYSTFWKSKQDVYVEELNGAGRYVGKGSEQ
jgi:hypothetical protein